LCSRDMLQVISSNFNSRYIDVEEPGSETASTTGFGTGVEVSADGADLLSTAVPNQPIPQISFRSNY
jgi:hypothetical protein